METCFICFVALHQSKTENPPHQITFGGFCWNSHTWGVKGCTQTGVGSCFFTLNKAWRCVSNRTCGLNWPVTHQGPTEQHLWLGVPFSTIFNRHRLWFQVCVSLCCCTAASLLLPQTGKLCRLQLHLDFHHLANSAIRSDFQRQEDKNLSPDQQFCNSQGVEGQRRN